MVNKVILIGNLGRDPEVRSLENGVMVAKFPVATNESYRDKNGEWQQLTEWHDVVAWRYLAERAERDLKKGSAVYIEGKLTHRKWQDQEGNNRKTTEVVASYFRILNRRDSDSGSSDNHYFPSEEDEYPTDGKAEKKDTSIADNTGQTADVDAGDGGAQDDLPF